MRRTVVKGIGFIGGLAMAMVVFPAASLDAQSLDMNFFLSVEGPGGEDFGAVVMSDGFCHDQGYAAGFGDRTWKAYMTGTAEDGEADEIARDRIGSGPWINYNGVVIAENLDELHSDENNLNLGTAVTVQGAPAPEGIVIPKGSELDGGDFTRAGPLLCFGT